MNTSTTANSALPTAQSDSFSWKRVGMIFRYVYPGLKKQILLFPVLSVLIGLCMLFAPIDITSSMSIAISIAYVLSPIGLAHKDFKPTMGMLPVTTGEKAAFLFGYFWIAVPLLLYLPLLIMFGAAHLFTPSRVAYFMQMYDLGLNIISPVNLVLTQFVAMAFQTMVLYVVINSSVNRILKGVATGICIYFGFVFVSAFGVGFYMAYKMVDYMEENPAFFENLGEQFMEYDGATTEEILGDPKALEKVAEVMGSDSYIGVLINNFLICVSLFAVALLIVEIVLICKKLKRGGF